MKDDVVTMLSSDMDEINETPKKKLKSHLYKQPTVEELNDLRETENLFHSNIFRMQITELLNEINLNDTETERYQKIANDLIKSLKALKDGSENKIKNLEVFKKAGVNIPLGDLCLKLDGSYKFQKPSKASIVGSFLLKNLIKPLVCIDVGCEMPSSYFNERDFMNYRYFIKRSFYMAHVYMKLSKEAKFNEFKFEYCAEHGSLFKPYLTLKPNNPNESFEIRLHFVPEANSFKPHRFNPTRSNLRKNLFSNDSLVKESDKDADNSVPTPHYNFEALNDLRLFENNEYLSKVLTSQGILDGLCLIKLWLYQRDLNRGYGSFNNFIISMFVAYLISIKKINYLMSSYQVFRIALLNLSQATWAENGISMKQAISEHVGNDTDNDEHLLDVTEFHKHFEVVFLDQSGYLNICANMSKCTLSKVKHEADLALKFLNDQLIDSFDVLFMRKLSFINSYDTVFSIQDDEGNVFEQISKTNEKKTNSIDFFNNHLYACVPIIEQYISKALDNRIILSFTKLIENFVWPVTGTTPGYKKTISIGLLFDKDYTNVLIKGPISNLPQALEFRRFWGDKSELRRFQDSTICEAVYFECSDIAAKRVVYTKIIKHILNLHLKINDNHIHVTDGLLEPLISLPNEIVKDYGTGEERLTSVLHTLDDLIKILKNLKDMPLSFANVQSVSSVARLTDVFSPLPCLFKYDKKSEKTLRYKIGQKYLPAYPVGKVLMPYVEPIKVCCLLETSSKWPDNIECIRRLKCAFNLKMVQTLRDTHGLVAFTNIEFSDVLYKGFVFRLFVGTTRELMVMKSHLGDDGIIQTRDTEESWRLEKNIVHLTKLTSVLHGLQQEYPLYGAVTRIAKRWLSSQLLMDYFNEETVDLICAYLFVHPEPYTQPKSLMVGFIRFIELLANFDWKNQALIININNQFKKDDVLSIQLNFQANRSQMPVLYIATPYDDPRKHSMWTKDKPSIQILFRTVLLSKECLKNVQLLNFDNGINSEHFKKLFRSNTSIYDVIIHLKPEYCPRAYQKIDLMPGTFLPRYRQQDDTQQDDKTLPIVDFDPVRIYVKQLRDAYSDFAMFFYDMYGGTEVYVLWKPKAFETRDFKVSQVNGRLPDINNKKLSTNIEAIVEDFAIVGQQLVKDVTSRIERWKLE